MTYDEAKTAMLRGMICKRPNEEFRVFYDEVRGNLCCLYDNNTRRKYIPYSTDKAATDWISLGPLIGV